MSWDKIMRQNFCRNFSPDVREWESIQWRWEIMVFFSGQKILLVFRTKSFFPLPSPPLRSCVCPGMFTQLPLSVYRGLCHLCTHTHTHPNTHTPKREGVIPSRVKIRLSRLRHINVSHNFVTFLILRLILDFSSLNIVEMYFDSIWT